MISNRFESLAQAFRVFTEQKMKFEPLLLIDAPEAVGNLDHAIDGILNAFHGLYDAAKIEAPANFDFYESPFCATALRLRNARHHNQANGVRSIYRCARNEAQPINYMLVDFPAGDGEEGGGFADYFVAWQDVLTVLDEQYDKYPDSVIAGREAIGVTIFEDWCSSQGYSDCQVFINLVPILAAACASCTGPLADYITPESIEAESFLMIFQEVGMAKFTEPDFAELTSAVFWPQ